MKSHICRTFLFFVLVLLSGNLLSPQAAKIEPQKNDSTKSVPIKPQSEKAEAKPESPKSESAKPAAEKSEPEKIDAKSESDKAEPVKPEPAKTEAAKPESTIPETPKPEAPVTGVEAPPSADEKKSDPNKSTDEEKQIEKLATESEKKSKAETDSKKESQSTKSSKDKLEPKDEQGKGTKKSQEAATLRVDFRDQEIQDVLKMFSKAIGKNIIADEKVKGKITVISPYKVPRSLAYAYLYSMLSIKGFGIVEETDNLIRVVAMKDAVAGSSTIQLGREEFKDDADRADIVVTQIMPVYGSKPSRLGAILKRLTSANTDLIDFDDIGMLIITGSRLEVNRMIKVANLIDYKPTEKVCDPEKDAACAPRDLGNVHVYRLENMQAENVEATLKKIQLPVEPLPSANAPPGSNPPPSVTQANIQKKPLDIVGHKETNTLIFIGTSDEFALVKSLIKRIDLQREQVLLEVLIIEVGSTNNNTFGFDWLLGKGGTAQFNGGVVKESGLVGSNGQLDTTRLNQSAGFSFTFLNDSIANILGILNAQIGKSNFVIVSAPQVLTLDNQEAEINVGKDVPVRVNSLTNSVGGNVTQSFEYRPTGLKLKFTPQVNKSRMVTLNLFQEIKSVEPASDPAANPTISKKDIKTVVRVADNQTIVIGGLISNNRNTQIAQVPILGELPIFGYLFKRTVTTVERKNLLIFITPHVLTNRAIADKVTEDLRQDQIRENKRRLAD